MIQIIHIGRTLRFGDGKRKYFPQVLKDTLASAKVGVDE